jgi:TolB-like protein/DNA-binding winged helix-turn-helix (wHTH) protein/tetratricopeptide (TPR) repeat protein
MASEFSGLYEFGPFRVDPARRLITENGEVIALAPKTFDLLLLFLQSDGRLLGKQDLITRLWPDTFVEDANLTFQIATLRKAVGQEAAQWIETIPKHGYRFTVPVRRVASLTVPPDAPETQPANVEVGARERTGRRVSPRLLYGGVGVAILLTTATAGVYWAVQRYHPPPAGEGGPGGPRVAVLPFANLSSEPDTEYFSDGLTEEVIHVLAANVGLQMVSRTSSFALKGKGRDLSEIGAKLKADAIIEGSVRRAGDRVRITVRLLQVSGDRELWSEEYDRKLTDIFTVQDEVARSVASALSIRLASRASHGSHASTTNIVAHDVYLKGRYFWNKRTPESLEKSVGYFEQAIREDSNFGLAYAGLADSYAVLGFNGIVPPRRAFPAAKSAALRALALDGSSAEANASLAFVEGDYDWDPAAERLFLKSIQLDPSYATAHDWYSAWLTSRGRFADAIRESERAQELEPLSWIVRLHAAWPYYYSRRYPEAVNGLRKALELEPGFGARTNLCAAYTGARLLAEAIAECERAAELTPDPFALAALGRALAVAGRRAEALGVLARLEQHAKDRYVSGYRLAMLYTAVGKSDRAFLALESALAEREPSLIYLNADPSFDTLRTDPRYSTLIDRIRPVGGR